MKTCRFCMLKNIKHLFWDLYRTWFSYSVLQGGNSIEPFQDVTCIPARKYVQREGCVKCCCQSGKPVCKYCSSFIIINTGPLQRSQRLRHLKLNVWHLAITFFKNNKFNRGDEEDLLQMLVTDGLRGHPVAIRFNFPFNQRLIYPSSVEIDQCSELDVPSSEQEQYQQHWQIGPVNGRVNDKRWVK